MVSLAQLRHLFLSAIPLGATLVAPTAYAGAWGQPWGGFSWLAILPVSVPVASVWWLAVIAALLAIIGIAKLR